MSDAWVVRWDTSREDCPSVLCASDVAVFDPPSSGFAVFDGYLFDRAELRGDRPASDASLIASAYERWQDALLDKLRGGFALAIWDRERRRLSVGRDAMGLHPCFYWWNGGVLLASPSLDAILARRECRGTFNRVVIAEYLQGCSAPHHEDETFYEEIRRLPPAHALTVTEGRLAVSRYWDPVPPGFAWATADETSRFEPILERAVGRCLSAGADSIALSGGFDSVSIASLAAAQLRGKPPLHALSLRFTGTVCDEAETQTAVARALGMPQLMRTMEEALGGATAVGAALALSGGFPSPVLSPWQSLYTALFEAGGRLGLGRLLMGTGGDDMLNVDLSYGADCLAALDLRALWRFFRATQRTSPFSTARIARGVFWEGAAAPELKRLARGLLARVSPAGLERLRRRRLRNAVPRWLSPRDRETVEILEHRQLHRAPAQAAPGERAYVLAMRELTQAPLLLLEQDQVHAWTQRLGFTLYLPYFDRDLVELSLRMSPEYLIAGGRHKSPLRQLVADRLPAVRMRAKKVDFTQAVHDVLRPHGPEVWRSLDGPLMLTGLGLVEAEPLDHFMRGYFDGRHSHWRRAWTVMATEAWLRARSDTQVTARRQEDPT